MHSIVRDTRTRLEAESVPPVFVQNEEQECIICLEGAPEIPCNWHAVCNHSFHKECMQHFYDRCQTTPVCPMCRIPIEEEDFEGPYVHTQDTGNQWMICKEVIHQVASSLGFCISWYETTVRFYVDLMAHAQYHQ